MRIDFASGASQGRMSTHEHLYFSRLAFLFRLVTILDGDGEVASSDVTGCCLTLESSLWAVAIVPHESRESMGSNMKELLL